VDYVGKGHKDATGNETVANMSRTLRVLIKTLIAQICVTMTY
jgi:hypothetical protein